MDGSTDRQTEKQIDTDSQTNRPKTTTPVQKQLFNIKSYVEYTCYIGFVCPTIYQVLPEQLLNVGYQHQPYKQHLKVGCSKKLYFT